jgi:cytochrome c
MRIACYPHAAAALLIAIGLLAPGSAVAAGDAAKGEAAYKKSCFMCHDTAAGKHKVGPSLHAVYGQKAGTVEGYKLYRGLRDATWTWDDQALDAYLADPPAFIKSKNGQTGSMVVKLASQQDRDDVIAYLKTLK